MQVKCLTAEEKDQIVLAYTHKTLNLKELAKHFNSSPRTIGRVLEERGLATPVPRLKGEAYQVMKFLNEHGLDLQGLVARLATPIVTPANVQHHLNNSSNEELAHYFYASGLVKIAESEQEFHANNQETEDLPFWTKQPRCNRSPCGTYGAVPHTRKLTGSC